MQRTTAVWGSNEALVMHNQHKETRFFSDRGFGRRIGFGTRPALIIVDYMVAFTDPQMPLGANLDAEIFETNRLLDSAHTWKLPVIFSVAHYEEDDFADAGFWYRKQGGISTLMAGTPAVEIDGRLNVEPRDTILLKKYASCFFGTDLVPRLNSRGCDTLILTGCTTSGCVRATAVDALQNGYRPIVAQGAVGDRSTVAHNQSLFDLDQKYADVMSVDEIIDVIGKLSRT